MTEGSGAAVAAGAGRAEPKNLEAEAACLGAILLDEQAYHVVAEHVRPEDFSSERHKVVFRAIEELSRKHAPLDLVTLTDHLRNHKLLEAAGGVEGLTALLESVPSAVNAEYYARIVREKAQLRALIATARTIIAKALDESLEAREIIDEAERRILEIGQREAAGAFVPAGRALHDLVSRLMAMAESHRSITGISTGFPELDRITDGFHEAEFVIIAARPSMGKTSFAMNIAEHMAMTQKLGVAFFSMEMPREQIMMRLLSSRSMVEFSKIRAWRLTADENERVLQACDDIQAANFHIDDSTNLTVFDIRTRLRRLMSETPIHAVFLDYIQLVPHPGYRDNRQQQVAEISRGLKSMAKELKIPVVVLSQLNRRIEDRKERAPQLADLKESGALEQDADLVIFLDREDVYKRESTPEERRGRAQVIVGKNRHGVQGTVEMGFDGAHYRFLSLERHRGGEGP